MNMTAQLDKAFETASKLPKAEQNILAEALIVALQNYDVLSTEDEDAWDDLLHSSASQQWLEKMVCQVENEIERGEIFDYDPASLKK